MSSSRECTLIITEDIVKAAEDGSLGLSFQPVKSEIVKEDTTEESEKIVLNNETDEEFRAKKLASQVLNNLDLPDNIIKKSRENLDEKINQFRDFLMTDIVPVVLAIEPACTSVKAMVTKTIDNVDIEDINLPSTTLQSYAAQLGLFKAKLKIIDMLGLNANLELLQQSLIAKKPNNTETSKER